MKRWIVLLVTTLLVAVLFTVYLPAWSSVPRSMGISLAIGMVAGLLLPAAVYVVTSKFSPRQKVAGWFYLAGAVAVISPSFFLRYMVLGYWPPWWYFVIAACISLPVTFACFAIATRIAPVSPRWPQANFSTTTSAPEHISHVK
jgi:hypothetical protein